MTDAICDAAAERSLLAACLDSKLARTAARKIVTGADFYLPDHEAIWDAMSGLERAGREVDAVSLRAALGTNNAARLMPDLVTTVAMPSSVDTHAAIVRSWAVKRRLYNEATQVAQRSLSPDLNAVGYAATVATRFANIRDAGLPDITTAETLAELLAEEDDAPDWLIPGLLERRDRLMLTGEEGLGKSYLLRQIAILAAAGLHPFTTTRIKPIKVTIIDCENSRAQVRRKVRPIVQFATHYGLDPSERVLVDCTSRMDITSDKSLARIHQLLDASTPDLVVIGPLYRLVPRALQSDDEAAPVLAALDTIRDRDITLLIEAHAGHAIGKHGSRDLRPRGSSALLGWPEFGYGMRALEGGGFCDVVPWRGDRDERQWPDRLKRRDDDPRWTPVDHFDYQDGAA